MRPAAEEDPLIKVPVFLYQMLPFRADWVKLDPSQSQALKLDNMFLQGDIMNPLYCIVLYQYHLWV